MAKTARGEFLKGLWQENAVLRMMLGLCPALAVTNSAFNGLAMGLATTFVLVGSNTVVSVIRGVVPSKVRIPAFIVIIATFVTIVDLFIQALNIDLYNKLGIFIPLITVNCTILGRAESFASKNRVHLSVLDGLGMGVGFTLALWVLASCREILGAGTITLYEIPLGAEIAKAYLVAPGALGENFQPALLMILPPGAFLVLGFLVAGMNMIDRTDFAAIFGFRRAPARTPAPEPASATRMAEAPSTGQ